MDLTKEKSKKLPKYMLMYAKDLAIPPNTDPGNMAGEGFRTFLGVAWFVFRNKNAQAAIHAGRFQFFEVGDK